MHLLLLKSQRLRSLVFEVMMNFTKMSDMLFDVCVGMNKTGFRTITHMILILCIHRVDTKKEVELHTEYNQTYSTLVICYQLQLHITTTSGLFVGDCKGLWESEGAVH